MALCALWCLGLAASLMLHCLCVAQHPTIQFSAGTKLGALQGAAQLAPKPGSSRSLRITMTAARFKVSSWNSRCGSWCGEMSRERLP